MAATAKLPWRMVIPLAIVVAIAAIWVIYWTVVSVAIKNAYAEAEDRFRAEGLSLACDEAEWGGFPFRVERRCRSPQLLIDQPDRKIGLSASDLLVAVQAYDPRHAIALLDGPTDIRGLDIATLRHERALASVKLQTDGNWQASLEVPKLAAENLGKADRLLVHARTTESDSADLAASGEKIEIPLGDGSILPIDSFELAATLPKEALGKDVVRYLSQTGKQVTVSNIQAKQGELMISGSGAITIDGQGYLNGRISTRIARIDLLFENVKRVAKLSADDVAAAKTFIDLLQQGGGQTEPRIDLIAKDRKLYFGPFRIADLEPLF